MKTSLLRLANWKVSAGFMLLIILMACIVYRDQLQFAWRMLPALRYLEPRLFSEEDKINSAKIMVESCMNVKRGEKVLLIVQDDARRSVLGKYLETEIRNCGANLTVIKVTPEEMMSEPPQHVVDAMMRNQVILAALGLNQIQIFAHTKARNTATDENGARLGLIATFVPGITHEDIMKIRERTDKVARILENGRVAHITGAGGTDLTFRVGSRCERLRASMWESGEWGAIPLYAEAALAPAEGTANGVYQVKGFFEYVGRVTRTFSWVIKNGRIVEVVGDGPEAERCREILRAADKNGTNIGELGVATNHIKMYEGFSGTIIDKMILGTLHIACGKNTTFEGGHVYSDIHHDAVSGGMTLVIDGTTVIKDGRFMLD